MHTLALKGNWNIAKGKFKQKFAQLTDDPFQFVKGKEDELLGRIQKRKQEQKNWIRRAIVQSLNLKSCQQPPTGRQNEL